MTSGLRWALRAGFVVAVAVAGCANAGMTPSASVTTTMQGWEHYFRLDWTPQARPNGVDIDGYVYNKHGAPMGNVQLLAQSMDASNNVVGQKLTWVHGTVPNFGRSYFRITGLPPGQQYRVSVWAFDIIESDSGRRRF